MDVGLIRDIIILWVLWALIALLFIVRIYIYIKNPKDLREKTFCLTFYPGVIFVLSLLNFAYVLFLPKPHNQSMTEAIILILMLNFCLNKKQLKIRDEEKDNK